MRTDREIQEAVLAALEWEPGVHAEHVGVSVASGVVTLQGYVTTLREKYLAERVARDVRDVRAIANDIDVAPETGNVRSDGAIAAAAANALEWDSGVPDEAVKATVRNGWVTLSGSVGWAYQRSAAERAVRNLTGVRGITNTVTIHPVVDAGDVKASIERAFERSVALDAQRIRVEARDGTIVLTGVVHSLSELDAAERAAWSAPGVTGVEDHLVVVS